ncbi:DODA-type extradiol aromatic ring-opening family dioxygenase [Picrophilus oshimae]|uniref:Aromatic ring-opening dioxygenase, LigB subunit n=1 Tax=Picrophilus torridus (strain ATCC 700027 / DSM 9790 / JCM 10055 / NBRC 100828 / KAW 2/3) TaxID=1122961 RepID=A0A8G2FWE5_PICTO|nr:hypothetical protein [Picrophilus oshimae]SMD30699.1 Aromatic ring-opening dioxygenase, LigB subunit [Picrophilus oshimae DSM 9789]
MIERIYVIPHGDEIIDMPDKESAEMNKKIREVSKNDKSDVKLIISPHGLRLENGTVIPMDSYYYGYYKTKTRTFRSKFRNDLELASLIYKNTSYITSPGYYITSSGEHSIFPLDFGSIIPLSFFKKGDIISIGQPRINCRQKLIEFGNDLYKTLEPYNKKVSVIISADQSHTHSNGIYGYSDLSNVYDNKIISWIKNNDDSIKDLDDNIIERAKPDSYWNMLILYGMIKNRYRLIFKYYYVMDYFSMLLAVADKEYIYE